MPTLLDTINERRMREGLPPIQDRGTSFLSDKLNQIQNSEGYTNENDLGTLAGAFGLGGLSMINDTLFGGTLGGGLSALGRGVEWISPFSGENITPNDKMYLASLGYTPEQIAEMYPHEDSWLTSLGKGSLELQNTNRDYINEWEHDLLGDNPTPLAKMARGAGTSVGFMGTAAALSALGGGFTPLNFALGMGGSEALAETGGFLGDAYRSGRYDDEVLSTAGKNFLTNMALNTTLDYFLSPVGKVASKVANPVGRYLAGTGSQIVNELLQEPSQQVIEQASMNSLNNGTGFLSELGESAKQWPEMFNQLAPEVTGSTLITQGLLGLTPLGIPGNIAYNRSLGDIKQRLGNVGEQLGNHRERQVSRNAECLRRRRVCERPPQSVLSRRRCDGERDGRRHIGVQQGPVQRRRRKRPQRRRGRDFHRRRHDPRERERRCFHSRRKQFDSDRRRKRRHARCERQKRHRGQGHRRNRRHDI